MNNIFFITCILLALSINVKAQQNSTKETSAAIKVSDEPVRSIRTESSPIQMRVWNENDQYGGQKEEFTQMFISNVLPDDFPKHKVGTDINDYKNTVDSYFKLHTNILREKDKIKYETK